MDRVKDKVVLIVGSVLILVGSVPSLEAQTSYKVRNSNEIALSLSGTTPLRNWKMSAQGLQGDAKMVISTLNQLIEIDSLTFSLPVRNLKGDQAAMDKDAYRVLKADRYKEIVFSLNSAKVEPEGEHLFLIKALGNLTVAGVTKEVTFTMHSKIAEDESISFTGSEVVRMSDYNVERPSLLLGTIRAGDKMTLTYTLIFSK